MGKYTVRVRQNTLQTIIDTGGTVLIEFYSDTCQPCKRMEPDFERLAKDYPDIVVGKVNIKKELNLAREYNVMAVPTLILFKEKRLLKRAQGAKNYAGLQKFIGVI
jgi:thioredoxin 1